MKKQKILQRIVMCMVLPMLLMTFGSCQMQEDEDHTERKVSYVTSPAPVAQLEENAILRRPDTVANPSDYADITEPAETAAPVSPNTGNDPQNNPKDTETRISFVAVGDNILHSAIIEDAAKHAGTGEDYNFKYIYDNVRSVISAADVAFVNQETPMGGKSLGYYGYPNFNGPQEAGDALVDCGFDIVCIATNHMADLRDAGLSGTIDYWNKQPVTLVGGYKSQADFDTVRVHEKNGVKIALLAYTYGTNGMSVSTESGLVIPLINEADITRQVALAKEAGDLVVVNMHWGTDSSFTVTEEQKQYAQLLADLGVDVIIGEHPHVLQPMQWIDGKNGNKTLLTYSIGNFLSTMYNDYFMVGGMLSFDIVKNTAGTHVENVQLIPTVTYYDVNRSNLSIYFLDDFTEELASSHGTNVHGATSLEQLRGYVTNAIPSEFLPKSYR